MKASPRQQRLLLELQALDTTIARLGRRREQLPERGELATLAEEVRGVRERFMNAQRTLEDLNTEIERLESDIETVRQRQQRTGERLSASVSGKEAQALQEELDALAHRKDDLEERELDLMDQAEKAQRSFDAAAGEVAHIDDRRRDLESRIEAAEKDLDADQARIREEREGLSAEIQRDLLDLFTRTQERYGIGAAKLSGRVSEGSNMELADAEYAAVMNAPEDEIVFCPVSGAILVRESEDA